MDYSKLSDQEINMAVAAIAHPESTVIESKSRPPCACITGHLPGYWVDYCNNVADAWPIIAENEISIIFNWNEEGLHGATNQPWISSENTNPLRAAMECLLMMQEHKHG